MDCKGHREHYPAMFQFMYIWRYVDYHSKLNAWRSLTEEPSRTELFDRMSNDLIIWGQLCCTNICYAFMLADDMT